MLKKYLVFAFVAIFTSGLFLSCKDDKKDDEDGKIDPSTIAASNLVAHFAFEGDGKDAINALTPTNAATTSVTFPDGRRGKGFQGTADASKSGLLYSLPANSKLRNLKAFSVSVWVKMVPNTVQTTDSPEQMVFHIDGTGDWIWGNLFLLQHRNWPLGESERDRNYAEMDCFFFKEGVPWFGQRGNGWFIDVTAPQWKHIICTYDNATSQFHAYVNGVHVTAFDGSEYMGVDRKQSEDGPALGDLKFVGAERLAIGTWCTEIEEGWDWASPFKGMIDELRIYDRGLTAAEAKDLYDAEVTQVNE